jgi:hypothetical protein
MNNDCTSVEGICLLLKVFPGSLPNIRGLASITSIVFVGYCSLSYCTRIWDPCVFFPPLSTSPFYHYQRRRYLVITDAFSLVPSLQKHDTTPTGYTRIDLAALQDTTATRLPQHACHP